MSGLTIHGFAKFKKQQLEVDQLVLLVFLLVLAFGIGGNTVNFNYLDDSTTSGP